jgi:hypothetical protein
MPVRADLGPPPSGMDRRDRGAAVGGGGALPHDAPSEYEGSLRERSTHPSVMTADRGRTDRLVQPRSRSGAESRSQNQQRGNECE